MALEYDFSKYTSFDADKWKEIQLVFSACSDRTEVLNSNTCTCGGILLKDVTKYICKNCGIIKEYESIESEYEEDMKKEPSTTGRLRVVGPSSNYFQSDLYRSCSGVTSAMQTTQIYDEFIIARDRYIERGGKPFPISACKSAAAIYNAVQHHYVKRNQNKKVIMAMCLHIACIQENFVPPKSATAELMGLNTKGIAKGENFLRSFAADGKIDIDININPLRAEIETIFMQLKYTNPDKINHEYNYLKDAAEKVVQLADEIYIGHKSITRSKVAGAVYEILKRCKNKELVPNILTTQEFCQKILIRKNTIERFIKELYNYHSKFEYIYSEFGLDTMVLPPF